MDKQARYSVLKASLAVRVGPFPCRRIVADDDEVDPVSTAQADARHDTLGHAAVILLADSEGGVDWPLLRAREHYLNCLNSWVTKYLGPAAK